ncbi:hypothetical protein SK128_026232 [Halocaridina rubra]|uniref:Uncharacterized protein n=1 Tax=Halocaridina rubra TaxID=373956 RepID=A0AAN8WVW2_HALRR
MCENWGCRLNKIQPDSHSHKKNCSGLCQVLPAVHTLTGCDYTSKVGIKHAVLMGNPEIHLNDFMIATGNMDNAVARAEAYLTQVLKKGTGMKTMHQLRNYKYHHAKRSCVDDLPPTSHAIRLHIRRAFFATHQMVSLLSPCEPLDPKEFGFELIGNLLVPTSDEEQKGNELLISLATPGIAISVKLVLLVLAFNGLITEAEAFTWFS